MAAWCRPPASLVAPLVSLLHKFKVVTLDGCLLQVSASMSVLSSQYAVWA